jgi:endonuclease/exonuclease/phosphatase family metal-dependent hydrolase
MTGQVRVLTWNLYHGRDVPAVTDVNRPLLREFAELLDRLDWDVALLQEAPPLWHRELCRRTGSSGVRVWTSRNWWPWLQRKLADWNPDLIRSSEGGSNQILVRRPGQVLEHRRLPLARWPERRRMHWVRLDGGVCVANLHASTGRGRKTVDEVLRAARAAVEWSGPDALVFGGDLNVSPGDDPAAFALLSALGFSEPTAPDAIDHVLACGLSVAVPPRPVEREVEAADGVRIRLSDHAPVLAEFVR